MALASYQQQLFYVNFSGGSLGTHYWNIVFDENTNEIYVANDSGFELDYTEVGYPSPSIVGDYSYHSYQNGTFYTRFIGTGTYPYAAKEEAVNPYYKPNLLRIITPILYSDDDGTDTGAISVQVENAQATVTYTISPSAGSQSDNEFYDLPAGNYRIEAYDGYTRVSLNVKIKSTVVYGLKYTVTYFDRLNRRSTIYIKKRNYTGSNEYLTGTGNPLTLNYPGNTEKFDAIFGSELRLNVYSETAFKFFEIFTGNNIDYIVEFVKESETKFIGYLLTDNYSEAYTNPPYVVSIPAVDGLGSLKNKYFLDDYGNKLYGTFSITDIICFILRQINLKIDVWFNFPYYHDSMDVDFSALSQTFLEIHHLYNNNDADDKIFSYDVLDKLLKSYNCRIYQVNGHYEISYLNDLKNDAVKYYVFNYKGEFQTTIHSVNHKIYNGGASVFNNNSFVYVNNNAVLELLPAYKLLRTSFTPSIQPLIGHDYSNVNLWSTDSNLYFYYRNADIEKYGETEEKFILKMDGTSYNLTSAKYIITTRLNVTQGTAYCDLNCHFKLLASRSDSDYNGSIMMNLELETSSTRYYYVDGLWSTTRGTSFVIPVNKIGSDINLTETVRPIPADGKLHLTIYQYIKDYANPDYVDGMLISFVKLENRLFFTPKEILIAEDIGDYNEIPDDFIIEYADAPDYDYNDVIYKKTLRLRNGTLTNDWGTGETLQAKLTADKVICYDKPSKKITANMIGYLDFNHVLCEMSAIGENYILSKLMINDKSQNNEVEWFQLETGTSPSQTALTIDTTDFKIDSTLLTIDQTVES